MQAKGLVQFIFAILLLGCIYQLSFTWKVSQVERAAEAAAIEVANLTGSQPGQTDWEKAKTVARRDYLNEKANENVYNLGILKYTYQECKKRELNRGLVLQGGMSLVLEVSKYDLIKQLSNDPENEKLISALDAARVAQGKGDGNFVKAFADAYEAENPEGQLVSLFNKRDNRDDLDPAASNAEVRSFIQKTADDGFEATFTKIRERVDKFGVAQASIQSVPNQGRVVIELPGIDNPEQAEKIINAAANLEFWRTRPALPSHPDDIDIQSRLQEMDRVVDNLENISGTSTSDADVVETEEDNTLLGEVIDGATEVVDAATNVVDDAASAVTDAFTDNADSLGEDLADDFVDDLPDARGPLLRLIEPAQLSAAVGMVRIGDTAKVNDYFAMEEVKAIAPFTKFSWGAVPSEANADYLDLYALSLPLDGSNAALLSGDIMKNAIQDFDPTTGEPIVTMSMNAFGTKEWKKITTDNVGRFIGVVLDNRVYSAPVINEPIPNGMSRISGFDIQEAKTLATILETGKLPVKTRVVQKDVVGPSLGKLAIQKGLISLVVGLVLVLIFMVFYYSTGGIVADIALLANIFFVFGILATLGATLTLPGLAGIVLTVGMAVDANVIIFERIREELAKGKSGVKAIADGYRNSYSAIIDANLTTLIVAMILNYFGLGPVKGFAIVLMIGIFSSVFTAILVTRLIFDWMQKRGTDIKYYNSITKGAFKNIKYNFIENRKTFYMASMALIILGIGSFVINGFTLGVDFKGGYVYTVKFDDAVNTEDVREALQANMDPNVLVKSLGESNRLKLTTSYRIDDTGDSVAQEVTAKVYESLLPFYKDQSISLETWNTPQFKEQQQKVEPTIAKDIMATSIRALIFALIAIFAYIVLRFRKWQFGLGAVAAIFHDVIIVLAVFSIFRNIMPFSMEIGETFIAAILTVIGYSINDTVVVFDRVREYLNESKAGDFKQIVNSAVQSTLSRTLITSVTTLAVLLVLFIAGSEQIKGFAFAILIGILVGTYSSIFVATPIVVDFYKEEAKKIVTERKNRRRKPAGAKS